MTIPPDSMMYTARGLTSHLVPVCIYRSNHYYVIEAQIYDENGVYIGSWHRSTMPLTLIRQLERHHRYIRSFRPDNLGGEDADDPNRYMP